MKTTKKKATAKKTTTPARAPVETVLVLRTCDAELRAHGGFQWPASGHVEAPDWDPSPVCGHGLHGLLWGEGGAEAVHVREQSTYLDADEVEAFCGECHATLRVHANVTIEFSDVEATDG